VLLNPSNILQTSNTNTTALHLGVTQRVGHDREMT